MKGFIGCGGLAALAIVCLLLFAIAAPAMEITNTNYEDIVTGVPVEVAQVATEADLLVNYAPGDVILADSPKQAPVQVGACNARRGVPVSPGVGRRRVWVSNGNYGGPRPLRAAGRAVGRLRPRNWFRGAGGC